MLSIHKDTKRLNFPIPYFEAMLESAHWRKNDVTYFDDSCVTEKLTIVAKFWICFTILRDAGKYAKLNYWDLVLSF